jgi:hypothetical protein
MKTLLLTILLLCLPINVVWAGKVFVETLPATLSNNDHSDEYEAGTHTLDTIYIGPSGSELSSNNLTSTTSGIAFVGGSTGAYDFVLDMSGPDGIPRTSDDDTLYFGTDSTYRPGVYSGAKGISFGYSTDTRPIRDITLRGGVVYHDPDNMTGDECRTCFVRSDTMNLAWGITPGGNNNRIKMDSITVRVINAWREGQVIELGGKNIELNGCHLISAGYAYRDRQYPTGCCLMYDAIPGNILTEPGDFHIKVNGGIFEGYMHTVVYIDNNYSSPDSNLFFFDACTLKIDTRNYYGTTVDTSSHYASTTNAYALHTRKAMGGSYIKNCYIYSGDDYNGGRALMLQMSRASVENPFEISGNRIVCHEGMNREYDSIYAPSAIKIRSLSRGLWIHDNIITYIGDTASEIYSGYTARGEAMVYQYWVGPTSESNTGTYNNVFENNICSSYYRAGTPVPEEGGLCGYKFDDVHSPNDGSVFRNNFVYVDGNYGYDFGQYDGSGEEMTIEGDTIYMATDPGVVTNTNTFNLGGPANALNNIARDLVYQGYASPERVGHDRDNGICSSEQEITIQRTLSVYAGGNNDPDSLPVAAAACSVWNDYGDLAFATTTNEGGRARGVVDMAFYARVATDTTNAQFNPFTIHVWDDGLTEMLDTTYNITDSTYTIYLEFAGVAGSGEWTDTIETYVSPPTVAVDTFANDYTKGEEADSIKVNVTAGNAPGDSVILVWATDTYSSDSLAAKSLRLEVVSVGQQFAAYIVDTLTEQYTLYLSAWAVTSAGDWSSRFTTSRSFIPAAAAATAPVIVSIDSILANIGGSTRDSFRVIFSMPTSAVNDNCLITGGLVNTFDHPTDTSLKAVSWVNDGVDTVYFSQELSSGIWWQAILTGYDIGNNVYSAQVTDSIYVSAAISTEPTKRKGIKP